MSDASSPQSSPKPSSLVGFIESAGFTASPDVVRLQEYAATVQQHRHDIGASPHAETTRSTALWSVMHLYPDLGASLEDAGIDKAKLAADLALTTDKFTTRATTTRCHDDFANALETYFDQRTAAGPVDVAEVVLAILISSQDPTTGVISERLGNVDTAIALMRRRAGITPPAPAFNPDEFSGSVRELRRQFADFPTVTPGRIAAALQVGEAHADYAGGLFVQASFPTTGTEAPFDEWARRVRGRYDMDLVTTGPQVIDGRMFLLALADLDDAFAAQLAKNGVRDALASEVSVPTLPQPAPGDLEGGVSSEYVDPTKGIHLKDDRMGVAPYVSMLATVICDKYTKMPMSVGVFGEWGSGKSYFMGLLRGRIDVVRKSDSDKYLRDIRQISFNAWHYADSNLWASLGDEIFRQLLQEPDPDKVRQEKLREELGDLVVQRRELEASAQQAETEVGRLRTQIAEASADRDVKATDLLAAMNANPKVKEELEKVWRRLGIRDPVERARVLAAEVRGTATEAAVIRRSLADRRGAVIAVLAVLALVAVAGVALWPDTPLESLIRAVTAAASGLLATVVAVVTAAHQGLKRLREQMDKIRADAAKKAEERSEQELSAPLQALRDAEASRELAQAQLATVVTRVGELGRELAELAPGQRLYSFLADRVAAGDYARNLGLISTIRKDFEKLIDLMDKWRARHDKNEKAPAPIERIVLYIDDLDRCSPRQVVDVLQAVHLLLALELFVVVVGVDPRWLVRSLQQQYPKLLDAPRDDAETGDGWDASPEDYLEKIFGIPFILPGMTGHLERVLKGIFEDQRRAAETDDESSGQARDDESEPTQVDPQVQPSPGPAESRAGVELDSEVNRQDRQDGNDDEGSEDGDDGDTGQGGGAKAPAARPLTDAEVTMLAALEPLVRSPREAKRLANVYRMIRANKDLSDASRFMGATGRPGEYEAVVVLLGLLSAHARLLGAVLDSPAESKRPGGLMSRARTDTWSAFVAGMKPRQKGEVWSNDIVATMTPADRAAWQALWSGLQPVTAQVTLRDLTALQAWAPSIRRFSFVLSSGG